MATSDPWSIIHEERAALAADLESLTYEQWTTASLCTGWNVTQVLGHMTVAATSSAGKFFSGLARSGFKFNKMVETDIARETAGDPAETLARFKAALNLSQHPPGPTPTWLGETIVHGEDIRRPLGIAHSYDPAGLRIVADFFKGSNLIIGAKKRIAGLTLKATEADWTTGSGPLVEGPLLSLVLSMTGRRPAYDDLSGAGVATLRSR
jgi:uncharacterized protein (TIGR03083 family)